MVKTPDCRRNLSGNPFICIMLVGIPEYGDKKSAKVKELDYYARTEQWDKIVESSQGTLTNYLNMCF